MSASVSSPKPKRSYKRIYSCLECKEIVQDKKKFDKNLRVCLACKPILLDKIATPVTQSLQGLTPEEKQWIIKRCMKKHMEKFVDDVRSKQVPEV